MPKNLVIIHYLCRQYSDTIYKPNVAVVFLHFKSTVSEINSILRSPMATVFMKLYIYVYEVKRLSNMPKNIVIIHYLCRQYYETIYKPNAALVFYILNHPS